MKMTYFYVAIWYALLQWKGFGLAGVFNLKHIYQFGSLLGLSIKAAMEERIYQSETKDLADNSQIAEIVEEFKNYSYIPEIQPNLDNKEFKSSLLTASSTILEKSAC
jgi:hypothetical protein